MAHTQTQSKQPTTPPTTPPNGGDATTTPPAKKAKKTRVAKKITTERDASIAMVQLVSLKKKIRAMETALRAFATENPDAAATLSETFGNAGALFATVAASSNVPAANETTKQ